MKEAAGAFTGDEDKKAEGRAEKSKADAAEEAKQREKTRPRPQRRCAMGRDARTKDRWAA